MDGVGIPIIERPRPLPGHDTPNPHPTPLHPQMRRALLTLREPITRGAQKIADLIEGVTFAPAVTGRVLLDAATHLVKGVASELDDMEGVEDAGGVLELIVDGVLVSLEGIQRRDSHPRTEVFAALFEPVLMRGARPAWDQVHSSGPWGDPPLASGLRCR